MVYTHQNKQGEKYFLHKKGSLYYFSTQKGKNTTTLPKNFTVFLNKKTGLPMVRKK